MNILCGELEDVQWLEKGMIREFSHLLVSEPGKQWGRSSKHSLIVGKSLPVWDTAGWSTAKEGTLTVLLWTLMRIFRLFNALFIRFTCPEVWSLYAYWSSYSMSKILASNWEVLAMKARSLLEQIAREEPNQRTMDKLTIWEIPLWMGNNFTYLESVSIKLASIFIFFLQQTGA